MSDKAEEFYRDKLAEWMIAHDIPTGSADTFEELLGVIALYIDAYQELKRQTKEE